MRWRRWGPKWFRCASNRWRKKVRFVCYAIQLLIKIGPDAAPAVPALTATLADPEPELRRESLFALGAIGPPSAKATDKIVAKLADDDQEVRHAACYALGKIGPGAQAALPKLRTAMDSDDEFMRLAAVWASLKISPKDEELQREAVPYLVKGAQGRAGARPRGMCLHAGRTRKSG